MIFTYKNKVRIWNSPKQESIITIEAATQQEADTKFWRYLRYGKEIRFYV